MRKISKRKTRGKRTTLRKRMTRSKRTTLRKRTSHRKRMTRRRKGGFPPLIAAIPVGMAVGTALHSARCSLFPNSFLCSKPVDENSSQQPQV
jgi:hypothetical protein